MRDCRRKMTLAVIAGWLLLAGFMIGKHSTEAKFQAAWGRLQTSEMTDSDIQMYEDQVARFLTGEVQP